MMNTTMFDISKIENKKHCIEYFKSIRWKDGVKCPFCDYNSVYEFSDGERFKCKEYKKIFSIKVGLRLLLCGIPAIAL